MVKYAVEVKNLSCNIGGTQALDTIDLAIAEGESFAVLGPNGAGKTTLINILCTLQKPDTGSVRIAGIDALTRPAAARATIGVVFQDSSLDDRLSVIENLEFHGLVYGMPKRERIAQINHLLELVELEKWGDSVVRQLSGGMRRRLEIARALMHGPKLLFLDEPTTGLDTQTRMKIWGYLEHLRRETGLTLLVTTHYLEEMEGCSRILILDHGKRVAEGTPAELKAAHGENLLRIMPRDDAVASDITAAFPHIRHLPDGELILPMRDDAEIRAFMANYGHRLSRVETQTSSLASVFISLTGQDLRDNTQKKTGPDIRRMGRT